MIDWSRAGDESEYDDHECEDADCKLFYLFICNFIS